MNDKRLVFYLYRFWKVAVGKVFSRTCRRILLKAKTTCPLLVTDKLGIETKVPYNLLAIAC
jgi:hypothetical protein